MVYTFHIVTIGHLSRNRYWGEDESIAYRKALCTCTLLSGGGEHILVDPSLPAQQMDEALLWAAGLHRADITRVYTTHHHLDHHVDPLFPNAQWFLPQAEIDYLRNNWDDYIRTFPGDDRANLAHARPVGEMLADGIRVVPLPGHTEGLCGLEFDAPEGRVLLTGDAVMTREFYQAGKPYLFGWDDAVGAETIRGIRGRYDVIIPGHGEAFAARAWERAAEY